MKAGRNKTISISAEDGKVYLDRCISLSTKASLSEVTDKTVLGDSFDVLTFMPENSVDLLIADPPYNLDKDFNGEKFRRMTDAEYEDYLKSEAKKAAAVNMTYEKYFKEKGLTISDEIYSEILNQYGENAETEYGVPYLKQSAIKVEVMNYLLEIKNVKNLRKV